MKPREIRWLQACQRWHYQEAVKFMDKQVAPAHLPFKQPPLDDLNDCLKWYERAKKWQNKLNMAEDDVETSKLLPSPPPVPPNSVILLNE